MAARRTPSSKKSSRKKTARKRSPQKGRGSVGASGRERSFFGLTPRRIQGLGRILAALAFVAGFALGGWIGRLDRIVVARFEGQAFRVPSKVLSAPTILYPGLDLRHIGLRETLARLGYRVRPSGSQLPVGSYRAEPWGLRIHVRAFDHPTRPEPAREIALRVSGGEIDRIRELPSGREVGAVLLEPALVGAYYGPDREQRDLLSLGDVPQHLVDAVLAVEDQRFEVHHGVDPRRIAGAFLANVRAGSIQQGASTLTQQLVKNFFLKPERTLRRKLQEAAMALLVEARYEKDAILEAYLNEIYLGQRGSTAIHGMGEATRLYFGKSVSDLTVGEAALLAAIIQSPNRISPHKNPELGTKRRNLVLNLMREQGRIDDATYQKERAEELNIAERTRELGQARYFLDVLRRQLPQVYDADVLSAEGLRVYSTLDLRLQRIAAESLVEGLESVEARRPKLASEDPSERLQGCLVALRPQTGEVLALVGGRDYGRSQFDRCTQARRQVGSIFKPFVYIAALEKPTKLGADPRPMITLGSFLDDSPVEIETPSGPWRPENYDHTFHGRVPVRQALELSLNAATARLADEVGIDNVIEVARRLGIESPLPEVPSLALGTADLSPLEVARAYATLANGGTRPTPHTFEDVVAQDGRRIERRQIDLERVLDPGTAYLATTLLEGVVERGTAARVRSMGITGPVAAKTGTTDNERDLWFVGFTPELVVVVWVGFDEPRSIGLASSSVALPIWVDFVREGIGREIRGSFLPPVQVAKLDIDPESGARALPGCPESRSEYFLAGTEPEETCPSDGARWGRAGANSIRGVWDWLRGRLE